MLCPKCGKENADDAILCVDCGEPLQAESAAPAEETAPSEQTEPTAPVEQAPSETAPRPRRSRLYAGIAAAVILLGVIAYLLSSRAPSLYSLVPKDSAALVVVDVPRFWNATEELRRLPEVRTALRDADRAGLSFEKDIVPCVGQIGCTMMEVGPGEPKMAFLVQIRNSAQALRCVKRAQSKSGLKWSEHSYRGVSLMRGKSPEQRFGPPVVVTTARIGGWFVIGVGGGVVEKVIDVAQGRAPSLQQDPNWSKALAKLPAKPLALFGADMGSPMLQGLWGVPRVGGPGAASKFSNYTCAMALTEKPDELRFDAVQIPKSARLRQIYKDLKAKTKGVSDKALAQLPDGTMFAALFCNPGAYFDLMKQIMRDSPMEPEQREPLDMVFRQIQPVEKAIKRCTGECGLAYTWKAGEGFGATVLAETDSNESAREAAKDIRGLVEQSGQPLSKRGGLTTLAGPEMGVPQFKLLPCWGAKGQWLAFSTHPDWLNGPKTKLRLPGEARGADSAAVTDFTSLPALLSEIEANIPSYYQEPRLAIEMVRSLELEKANLLVWGSTTSDGSFSSSTLALRGWNWRKGLKLIVQFGIEQYTRSLPGLPGPYQGHPYPPGAPTPYPPPPTMP